MRNATEKRRAVIRGVSGWSRTVHADADAHLVARREGVDAERGAWIGRRKGKGLLIQSRIQLPIQLSK